MLSQETLALLKAIVMILTMQGDQPAELFNGWMVGADIRSDFGVVQVLVPYPSGDQRVLADAKQLFRGQISGRYLDFSEVGVFPRSIAPWLNSQICTQFMDFATDQYGSDIPGAGPWMTPQVGYSIVDAGKQGIFLEIMARSQYRIEGRYCELMPGNHIAMPKYPPGEVFYPSHLLTF